MEKHKLVEINGVMTITWNSGVKKAHAIGTSACPYQNVYKIIPEQDANISKSRRVKLD